MKIISLFVLVLSSVSVFAANEPENCKLQGEIVLDAPTTIMCTQDLQVAPDTKIITNGFPLQILVGRNAHFANLSITSFPSTTPAGYEAAPIYLFARVATGNLQISNFGSSAQDMGAQVTLEYTSVYDYDHTIAVNDTTVVDVTLNGLPYIVTKPVYSLVSAVRR